MNKYQKIQKNLLNDHYIWLITGVAGFIGSNILEKLLFLNQEVVGVDNFSTGQKNNLLLIKKNVGKLKWSRFKFIKGDITNINLCKKVSQNVDFVLHHAALGSVTRSFDDPFSNNSCNIDGFLNMVIASRENKVKKFIFASSSSVYGDNKKLPKKELHVGNQLSPYALSKYTNEINSKIFLGNDTKYYGLRYFNVFGKYQSLNSTYAAVIPRWINAMIKNKFIYVFGDGKTSRDFSFVDNIVQANLLSAFSDAKADNKIFNIAFGKKNNLLTLFSLIKNTLNKNGVEYNKPPIYKPFREGDIKNSLADCSKAIALLGYSPEYDLKKGLIKTINWYLDN